jgi:hypothetical protein
MIEEISEYNYEGKYSSDDITENYLPYCYEGNTFIGENGVFLNDFTKMNTYYFILEGKNKEGLMLKDYFIGYKAHSIHHAAIYHRYRENIKVKCITKIKPMCLKPYKFIKNIYDFYHRWNGHQEKFYNKTFIIK